MFAFEFVSHFGSIFEQAAQDTGAHIKHHTFDASIVELEKEDIKKFIEHLHIKLLGY